MDDHGSKCTVIRLKVDGLDESKDKSGLSKNIKVDSPKVLKYTVLIF